MIIEDWTDCTCDRMPEDVEHMPTREKKLSDA